MSTPRRVDPRPAAFSARRRARRPPYGVVHAHVIRDVELSTNARLLYAMLCTYANGSGISWPSTDQLEADLGFSTWTRRRAQAELVAAGYLEVIAQHDASGRQARNLYVLVDDLVPAERGSTGAPPQEGSTSAPPVQSSSAPLPRAPAHPPSGGAALHPLEQPPENISGKPKPSNFEQLVEAARRRRDGEPA